MNKHCFVAGAREMLCVTGTESPLKVFFFTPNLVVFHSADSCISPLPLDMGGLTAKTNVYRSSD